MKKTILLFLLFIVSIASVRAAFQVDPISLDVSVYIGEPKNYTIYVTNMFNYTVYDISFSNLNGLIFSRITNLSFNKTAIITAEANPSGLISGVFLSTISHKFPLEIPINHTTFEINITASGFSPSNLEIRQGDTVRWFNRDNITRTLSSPDFGQEVQILVNGTYEQTFGVVKQITYQDSLLMQSGTINVISSTSVQYVHDPLTDQTYQVQYISRLIPTEMEFVIWEGNNATLRFGTSTEGLIKIRNGGTKKAINLTVSSQSNWLRFTNYFFDLDPGSTKYVPFTINPVVYTTEETNRTYDIQIALQGINTNRTIAILSVFLDYYSFEGNATNQCDWWREKKVFCDVYPSSPFCVTEPIYVENNITVLQPAYYPYNWTASEITEMLRANRAQQDAEERIQNQIKIANDRMDTSFPVMLELLNKSITLGQQNKERQDQNSTLLWIFITGIIIIVCVILLAIWVRKNKERETTLKAHGM